jgi:hypothetical protein
MTDPSTTTPPRRPAFLLGTWAIAAIAQFLIATNPGYFSHDELQWAVRAAVDTPAQLPWFGWSDLAQFQWRPLTFNLWLPLSWLLFAHPLAWHLLWVAIGAGLATVFAALLHRLGATERTARTAALAFALGPYAVYVHGWVATLADLLWLGIALALAHALLTMHEQYRRGAFTAGAAANTTIVAFAATALALAAKEAALAIPAVLALAWLLRRRERWLAAATLGAGIAAVVYLVLRLPVLLSGAGGDAYALAPDQVPKQWLAYHLFVLRPSTFEVAGLWNASTVSLAVAGAMWLGLWTVVLRANPRLGLALVLGGAVALAPTLPLAMTSNQYGYAFSAWTIACVALAWPRLSRGGRALVWVFMLVTIWHGANVQREMRRAGERQALFQPALVAALETHRGPLRLHAPEREWLYRRLTTGVPSWHGHQIGERVRWVGTPEAAHLVVAENGQLVPP